MAVAAVEVAEAAVVPVTAAVVAAVIEVGQSQNQRTTPQWR